MLWLVIDVVLGLALGLVLRRFVCIFVRVKGRSMLDSLNDRDVLFALRRRICGVKKFDVVICRYPNRKGFFVKRVIGMPGESISAREGKVYINEEILDERFSIRGETRDFEKREIEVNKYFVMGDNRQASNDSRRVGAIEEKNIVAVVKRVIFPFANRNRRQI